MNPKLMRFLSLLCLITILLVSCLPWSRSDKKMINHYSRNKTIFEALSDEVKSSNTLSRVKLNYVSYRDSRGIVFSTSVLPKVQITMKRLGIEDIDIYRNGDIFFEDRYNSSLNASKGFAVLTEPPRSLVNNLSKVPEGGDYTYYRHIEGDWYLYLEYDQS